MVVRAPTVALLLCGLMLAASGEVGAEPPRFTTARLLPDGAAGLAALLSGDVPDRKGVAQAVAAQGFFAGEPLGSGECAGCHADIAAQWASSAHRFASFNNPYYAASVEELRRQRPLAAGRFCAACHDPLLLVDDAVVRPVINRAQPAAQAGLPCLVCHSVHAVPDLRGNGGYDLRAVAVPPPRGDGAATPVSAHTARLRPAIMGQSAFCSTCHKVGLLPELTHDGWLRGQNDYDAWQSSMAAGNGAAAIYRGEDPLPVKRCQDCHMPLEAGRGGRMVRSHRFLGGNAALPALRDDPESVARQAAFLRGAVSLDLLVTRLGPRAAGALPAVEARVPVEGDEEILIDAVLRNRRVGHRFPGGTNDSNDVWLTVEARGADGEVLRDETHQVRAQPVDEDGRPLVRRDPQRMRGVVYDTSVAPADPQVVRYRLDLRALRGAEVEVRASLRYRKFTKDYAAFACAALPATVTPEVRRRCLSPPELEVASARTLLVRLDAAGLGRKGAALGRPDKDGATTAALWTRYLDHGLGLADGLVDRAGDGLPSLLEAARLAPGRAEPLLGLGRLYLAQGRTQEVLRVCAEADRLRRDHPAGLWLRAQALYRTYRWAEARPYLERAAVLLPTDRLVLGLLARVRGLLGDSAGALALADRILQIDPESEEGHYQRMLALRELGRAAEAAAAEVRYLYHRRPVERDQQLRALFRQRDPARPEEEVLAHVHTLR